MACDISNFSPDLYELEFDKGNADHRKLIRHLYRRIGYGASLADIENAHGVTINDLVNELIDGHLNAYERDEDTWNIIYDSVGNPIPVTDADTDAKRIFDEGKFDWVDRDITLRRFRYCDNNMGTLILGSECGDENSGERISSNCDCAIPLGSEPTKVITENNLPPTRQNELISNYWTNESIIGGTNSVRAKLMLFWHDHFAVDEFTRTSGDPYAVLRYFKVLFNNSFGNFRTFVEKIGRTPMMLIYLNGEKNSGHPRNNTSSPDENYARELLELFTMGEEYDGTQNYNSEDIAELARALTGWRIRRYGEPNEGEFRFQYGLHDWTSKTFLGETIDGEGYWKEVFGAGSNHPQNTIPNGNTYTYTGGYGDVTGTPLTGGLPVSYPDEETGTPDAYITAGDLEYKRIHEIIFTKKTDAIAYFICRKLYEFYIYGDVEGLKQKLQSDEVDDYIESLAVTFKTNWDIIPVLKQLFKSQHFFDAGIIGAQIKSPFECGTSIFRAANLQGGWGEISDDNQYDYIYKLPLLSPDYPIGNNIEDTYVIETNPDHPSYYGGNLNRITGEGMVANELDDNGVPKRDMNGNIINYAGSKGYRTLQKTDTWQLMYQHCGAMGQKLFNPPNVAGWETHQLWLNAFTWIKRRQMAAYFLNTKFVNTGAVEKYRQLAMKLLEIKHPNNYHNYYNNPEEVTRVMWEHFIPVAPTDDQIKSAKKKYEDGWPRENYGPITLHPETLAQWSTWTEEERAATKKGIGIHVLNMVQDFAEQPEYQLN